MWASLQAEDMRQWAHRGSCRTVLLASTEKATAARGCGQLRGQHWKHYLQLIHDQVQSPARGVGVVCVWHGRDESRANAAAHLRCPSHCAQPPGSSALVMSAGQA